LAEIYVNTAVIKCIVQQIGVAQITVYGSNSRIKVSRSQAGAVTESKGVIVRTTHQVFNAVAHMDKTVSQT
jgi:hypothetical protein